MPRSASVTDASKQFLARVEQQNSAKPGSKGKFVPIEVKEQAVARILKGESTIERESNAVISSATIKRALRQVRETGQIEPRKIPPGRPPKRVKTPTTQPQGGPSDGSMPNQSAGSSTSVGDSGIGTSASANTSNSNSAQMQQQVHQIIAAATTASHLAAPVSIATPTHVLAPLPSAARDERGPSSNTSALPPPPPPPYEPPTV